MWESVAPEICGVLVPTGGNREAQEGLPSSWYIDCSTNLRSCTTTCPPHGKNPKVSPFNTLQWPGAAQK